MLYCRKIFRSKSGSLKHQTFEWNTEEHKKLKAVFCSPGTQLSLTFENGKKIILRGFECRESKDTKPNNRVFKIEKDLDNEIISGIISKAGGTASVYLILEK